MISYTDIPRPEDVGANHNSVIRPILNHERSSGNQNQPYVVQAWSNTGGWQNTRYRSAYREDAQFLADWLKNEKSRWIGGEPTETRVHERSQP